MGSVNIYTPRQRIDHSASQQTIPERLTFAGIPMISDSFDKVADWIFYRAGMQRTCPVVICHLNINNYHYLVRNRKLLQELGRSADFIFDGIGMKLGTYLMGLGWREDLNGTDLFPLVMKRLAKSEMSVYLLGATEDVIIETSRRLHADYPGIRIAGLRSGYFEASREQDIIDEINCSRADIVLVGRGTPLQEQFAARHLGTLKVPVLWMVGGLFDFIAGNRPRAPLFIRRLRLEWLYRFVIEPHRKWHRILVSPIWFAGHILANRFNN